MPKLTKEEFLQLVAASYPTQDMLEALMDRKNGDLDSAMEDRLAFCIAEEADVRFTDEADVVDNLQVMNDMLRGMETDIQTTRKGLSSFIQYFMTQKFVTWLKTQQQREKVTQQLIASWLDINLTPGVLMMDSLAISIWTLLIESESPTDACDDIEDDEADIAFSAIRFDVIDEEIQKLKQALLQRLHDQQIGNTVVTKATENPVLPSVEVPAVPNA